MSLNTLGELEREVRPPALCFNGMAPCCEPTSWKEVERASGSPETSVVIAEGGEQKARPGHSGVGL